MYDALEHFFEGKISGKFYPSDCRPADSEVEDAVLTVPKTLRLDGGMAKRILGIGIPSAFENSLFEAGRILVVSMISTFGTVQIAANAVANNLDGMGVIPGKAISLAMITVVGRCIGAGDHEQTVYYTRKLMLWAYITMGLSNGAILLFLRQLVGIYALSGETISVAASPTPHAEILEVVKEILAEKNITLDIQVYNDYVVPNTVVEDGTVDANYFQHIPYLESFNEEKGTHLVNAGGIHYEPFGLYPGTETSLDNIDNATIAVPNDTTNEARALLLLQDNGYITLTRISA